jgi:hypothetical protein
MAPDGWRGRLQEGRPYLWRKVLPLSTNRSRIVGGLPPEPQIRNALGAIAPRNDTPGSRTAYGSRANPTAMASAISG